MTRLLAALFVLVLSVLPAVAEPPACLGENLLARLAIDNPRAHAAILDQAAGDINGNALLWKVEGEGMPPSWLFGTAHVTDPRVTTLPEPAERAFAEAQTVALELAEIADPGAILAATMRHADLVVLPPGRTLWDLVPDADEPAIRDNPNLPPGAAGTIYGYQPWMVATMLSVPACEAARGHAGIPALDQMLAQRARARGARLVGLETVEEQLAVFANMPLELQTDYLVSVARLGSRTEDWFETMIALYLDRRIAAYVPLAKAIEPAAVDDKAMMAFVEQDLTRKRNAVMATRAAALLAEGGAFIAVGALHLPGAEGLVELVRKAGYKVTPVN